MTADRPVRRWRAACAALLTLAVTAGCSAVGGSGDGGSGGSAEDTFEPPARYVALGDSFTAAPFVPSSVEAEGCYRSTGNYPALVAASLGVGELVDVSCSGADTTHMTRPQSTALGTRVPPQLEALTPETDLVTLGIGGNDFDVYGTMIGRCPALAEDDPRGAPCRTAMTRDGGDALLTALDRTQRRVRAVVEAIRERSPEARVLLVSYPQLTPAEGTCETLPLAKGDYAYARTVAERLDTVLRTVAERTGVELVDLWTASEGHDVCSDDPWVNGAVTDFAKALQYHPFAAGQQAAAELVVEAVRG